jgi:hypothetical protein
MGAAKLPKHPKQNMRVSAWQVALVVWWVVCLPLDTKVAGSNPAKAMDF